MSARAAEISTCPTPILDRLAPLPRPEEQRPAPGFVIAAWIALSVGTLAALVFWHPPFLQSLWQLALLYLTQVLPPQLTAMTIVVLGISAALTAFAVPSAPGSGSRSIARDLPELFELRSTVRARGAQKRCRLFQARRRRRVDLAQQWLGDIQKKPEFLWLAARAEAAIQEAKDDPEGALNKLDQVEDTILALPNEAQWEPSLRALRKWKSELRTHRDGSAPRTTF